MTLIERDHLLAHIQDLIRDHGTLRVLGQILKLKLMRPRTKRAMHLPLNPHIRRDIGCPLRINRLIRSNFFNGLAHPRAIATRQRLGHKERMLDDDTEIHPLFEGAPKTTEFKKLRKRLLRKTREAIEHYGMIEPGARWLVCLSGGKDSYTLLAVLYELKWRGLLPVDLIACNLDQGQPGFPATVLPEFLERMQVPHRIEYRDTYSVVMDKTPAGRTFCALCSRLRRANLYRIAREEGCSAVVLGHHRDDILETFFMNLFHGGRLATMPPKLVNEDKDLFLYRPLAHVAEKDCEAFAKAMNYPIIPCDLCGSQDGLQRQQVKAILDGWEANHPGRRNVLFRALTNARPSHLLDSKLFDFLGLALDPQGERNPPAD